MSEIEAIADFACSNVAARPVNRGLKES